MTEYQRQKLAEKSDVYSFGVVLIELLFARPAVLRSVKNEDYGKVNLADRALNCYQMGTLEQNIDPFLQGKINPECFKTFTGIAKKCLADKEATDLVWGKYCETWSWHGGRS
ncbi:hypothetical protein J1N35_042463 [Gossypium stocksii]|uniref:Serine-threonine/tyrosine-protein kinase catalytic domain-containing protein n=1 Tax=Gossypium stocksii TaxID=47602 RepID=A0A9D3ZJL8_9ROSI|nr:hypothetical protein J1N35_042463 [Gossypium stocksii]